MDELTRIIAIEKNGNIAIKEAGDPDSLIALASTAFMRAVVDALMNGDITEEEAVTITIASCGAQIEMIKGKGQHHG